MSETSSALDGSKPPISAPSQDGGATTSRRRRTLFAASTLDKEIESPASNVACAARVGQLVASRATAGGVKTVVFDRGGHLYHGKIKALADAARSEGLEF